jgi:ribose 5-phosphate isomerase B
MMAKSHQDPILIASDHAGFELKEKLEAWLRDLGYRVRDLGAESTESTDYPDYAHPLARQISDGTAERGILLCGTGLGMSYVANRYPRVRAAVAWSPEIAQLARRHNDANVLALPARFLSEADARQILMAWLETPFEHGRHERRVQKIERAHGSDAAPNEIRNEATETR